MRKKTILVIMIAVLACVAIGCNSGTETSYVKPPSYYAKDFYPGAHGSRPVIIYNHNDWDTVFSVGYEYPNTVDLSKGYAYPPLPARDWVTFDGEYLSTTVTVPAKSIVEVMVMLDIPENALVPKEKWVFHVVVMELGQEGMVHIRYAQQWFISMKPASVPTN